MNLEHLLAENNRAFNLPTKKNSAKISESMFSSNPISPINKVGQVENDVTLPVSVKPINLDSQPIDDNFSFKSITQPEQIARGETAISTEDISDEIERLSRSYPQNMESWMDM